MLINCKFCLTKTFKYTTRLKKIIFHSFSSNMSSKSEDINNLPQTPKFELLKIPPKFQNQTHIFYQKPKKVYNLILNSDFEKFKYEMMNCSILDQLDFYDQNKNKLNETFYENFIIILSQKLELCSYEYMYSICYKIKKFTMNEIVEKMRKSSNEIKSKSSLFSNVCLFYVLGTKELKYFDRDEIEKLLKIYTKYLSEHTTKFTFSEKLQITTAIAHFQNINFDSFLAEDFHEIEKIGYFELTKIMHRITKFKSSHQTKLNLVNLIVYPYFKMSLVNSLNNKINAFFLLNSYSSEILSLDLINESEELLISIKKEFNEKINNRDIKELMQFKWIELFKGLSAHKGRVDESDKQFYLSVYDILFEEILMYLNKTKDDHESDNQNTMNLFKFVGVLYRISCLSSERMPQKIHLDKFCKFVKENSKQLETLLSQIPQQHMLGIFLIMRKSNYTDLEVVKLFSRLLVNKLHLYDISENSLAFKEILKENLKEENLNYEKIKSIIVDNTYNYSIKHECRFLPLMKQLGASCFFSEKPDKKIDSIFYNLIGKMNENKDLINIYSNFLHYYVENHQKNIFPEYRAKIIKKFLEILTKEKVSQISYGSAIVKCYMYLNQLKLPESEYDELKTQILQLISSIHKLPQFKTNFVYQLKSYAMNKFFISNSAIVSIVITINSLYKELFRNEDLHVFQNSIISFVYFAIKNDNDKTLDKDALNSLLKSVDEISLVTNKFLKNRKSPAFFEIKESFEIYLNFLENGLHSDVLKMCYFRNLNEFKDNNNSFCYLFSLYRDCSDFKKSHEIISKINAFNKET